MPPCPHEHEWVQVNGDPKGFKEWVLKFDQDKLKNKEKGKSSTNVIKENSSSIIKTPEVPIPKPIAQVEVIDDSPMAVIKKPSELLEICDKILHLGL